MSSPTPSRRAAWLLTAAGAAAAVAALGGRLLPLSDRAVAAREAALRRAATERLERDAGRMREVAERLQRSRAFADVVDGGMADARPARLFALLADALPSGNGWGVVFHDRRGEAVAWAGEAADLPLAPEERGERFASDFSVTRFTLAFVSRRVTGQDLRGALVVSRRYPTGILRPDLIAALGLRGGPTVRRLRVRASNVPGRLVRLDLEATLPALVADDVRRARARPLSVFAAGLALAAGFAARRTAWGVVAARLVLLLGAPRAAQGAWRPFLGPRAPSVDGGLLSSPADLALTGLAAVVVLRALVPRDGPARGRLFRGGAVAGGLALAAAVPLLSSLAGGTRGELWSGLELVPASAERFAAGAGGAALVAALLGAAAALLARAPLPPRGALAAAAAGGVLLTWALAAPGGGALVVAAVGSAALAAGLARPLAFDERTKASSRAMGVVLLAVAAVLPASAGLQAGRTVRLDRILSAAQAAAGPDRERRDEEGPASWESRVSRPEIAPWLPGGPATRLFDLARALWVRGANDIFPESGDLLTIRDEQGGVVSSYGVLRPGTEGRGTAIGLSLPVPGLSGIVTRVPDPPASDRDPLLSAAVLREAAPPVTAERITYDPAGRAVGKTGLERSDLPPDLVATARMAGRAVGFQGSGGDRQRVHVRAVPTGFLADSAPAPGPLSLVGSAVARLELVLPLLALFLVPPRRRPHAPLGRPGPLRWPPRLLSTFRSRLVAALLLSGALPLAGSVVLLRAALDGSSAVAAQRRALGLLSEARRLLSAEPDATPSPAELNEAAGVLGTDLLLYRNGHLVAASRALPVAAGLARERLAAPVAEQLADGANGAVALRPAAYLGRRVVEAAQVLTEDRRDALAVVLPEDQAARAAVDVMVLLAVAVALAALGIGGRAAVAVSRPVEGLVGAARRLAGGEDPGPLPRPGATDLARLVDAFVAMSTSVRERTESLAREREAAVALLGSLTSAVVLFREDGGRVLLANATADRLLPGRDLAERLAPPVWEPVRHALDARRPFEERIPVPLEEREHVFRVVVASLPSDADGPRGLLLLEDLTAFVRAERLTAWVEAARAVAHDVKNPLTPIRLSAERIQRLESRGALPPASGAGEAAAAILRQVEVLTERIGRLARFANPSAPEQRRMDGRETRALLEEIAADWASHETARVRVEVAEGCPAVRADRGLLRDALTNFVLNAVEALEGRPGSVSLAAGPVSPQDGALALEVSCTDDGPGPPGGDVERVFDPTFSTKARGSGMGLAAARQAVEGQGGSVFACRPPGGGFRIGFRLPAEPD